MLMGSTVSTISCSRAAQVATTGAWPAEARHTGLLPCSHTRVTGTQVYGLSATVFSDELAGSYIRSSAVGIQANTLIWVFGISS